MSIICLGFILTPESENCQYENNLSYFIFKNFLLSHCFYYLLIKFKLEILVFVILFYFSLSHSFILSISPLPLLPCFTSSDLPSRIESLDQWTFLSAVCSFSRCWWSPQETNPIYNPTGSVWEFQFFLIPANTWHCLFSYSGRGRVISFSFLINFLPGGRLLFKVVLVSTILGWYVSDFTLNFSDEYWWFIYSFMYLLVIWMPLCVKFLLSLLPIL